ncbi:MAG: hypothetical protein Q4G45_12740, partial [Actinomycetia bacterium]|nr:hypothetical protein [Actinomycetes bacterium]
MPQTPPHVYWLRRALVLVLAVMLVLGLVWLVSALSSDDVTTSQAPGAAVPSTPAAETTTPAVEPTGEASPT